MKKIGIIGGAGPLASALLYETLVQESYALRRQVPEIVLINYPFTRGLSCQEGKTNAQAIHAELSYCMQFLTQSGVELGILACNTLHLFLEEQSPSSFPFYHIPQLVVKAARSQCHHRLLILATQHTCRSNLYQMEGIQPLYPSSEDQTKIDCVIDRVLEGKILQEDADLVL